MKESRRQGLCLHKPSFLVNGGRWRHRPRQYGGLYRQTLFKQKMNPQKGWDGITHCQIIILNPLKYLTYTYRDKASVEKLMCARIYSLAYVDRWLLSSEDIMPQIIEQIEKK